MTITTGWELFEDLRAAQDEMLRAPRRQGWQPGQQFSSGTTPAAWPPAVDISERTLREVHMPAFAAAVSAGVAAIMPGFTDLAGIPMTANVALLRGWLRGRWGFKGVIISDYNAIAELMHHGIAADLADAAAQALKAGVDIDMMADAYRRGLPIALERGRVTMAEIDESVRRVLTLKEQLGLFDDPYRRGAAPESAAAFTHRRRLARAIAARAIVMLKNANEALPLTRDRSRRLAVLGPLADAPADMRGPWWGAGEADGQVSVVAGLRAILPDAEVMHAAGVAIESEDVSGISAALARYAYSCACSRHSLGLLGNVTMFGSARNRISKERGAMPLVPFS